MSDVKRLHVRTIVAMRANAFIRKNHYSGKVVPNSKLHFGVFLDDQLHGVMSFGSPMDKSKVIGLVEGPGTTWYGMLELNRMAFDDHLPKNSESRALAIAFRMLKKEAPHIKWILSFSDGTASGDGTIYRAVGFHLTQIKKNTSIYIFPDGARIALMSLTNSGDIASRRRAAEKYGAEFTTKASMKPFIDIGARPAPGFQLRYIKLLYDDVRLTCPTLPFSAIDEAGAGMLRGEKITLAERQAA